MRPLLIAIALVLTSCASQPIDNSEARKKANELCWRLRDQLKDTMAAARECAKQVTSIDGVDSARIEGNLVKVKFSDTSQEYGIWMK